MTINPSEPPRAGHGPLEPQNLELLIRLMTAVGVEILNKILSELANQHGVKSGVLQLVDSADTRLPVDDELSLKRLLEQARHPRIVPGPASRDVRNSQACLIESAKKMAEGSVPSAALEFFAATLWHQVAAGPYGGEVVIREPTSRKSRSDGAARPRSRKDFDDEAVRIFEAIGAATEDGLQPAIAQLQSYLDRKPTDALMPALQGLKTGDTRNFNGVLTAMRRKADGPTDRRSPRKSLPPRVKAVQPKQAEPAHEQARGPSPDAKIEMRAVEPEAVEGSAGIEPATEITASNAQSPVPKATKLTSLPPFGRVPQAPRMGAVMPMGHDDSLVDACLEWLAPERPNFLKILEEVDGDRIVLREVPYVPKVAEMMKTSGNHFKVQSRLLELVRKSKSGSSSE